MIYKLIISFLFMLNIQAQGRVNKRSGYEVITALKVDLLNPQARIVVKQLQTFDEECARVVITKDEISSRVKANGVVDDFYNLRVTCFFNDSGAPVVMGVEIHMDILSRGSADQKVVLAKYRSSYAQAKFTFRKK